MPPEAKPTQPPGLTLDQGRCLLAQNGAPVLRELAAEASLRPHAGGVVVGLTCSRDPSSLLNVPLGKLACTRFLALSKAKQYWMVPAWGSCAADVPVESQLLLLELGVPAGSAGDWQQPEAPSGASGGGSGVRWGYALLLPLIDSNRFRASLRPARRGDAAGLDTLMVRMESGDESVVANFFANTVFIQAGPDPFQLLEEGVEAAVKLSGSGRVRREKAVPPTLDLFGWCTWDAMWTDVNPKGIQEGLRLLREGGTPARLLVIDDGWMSTDVDPEFQADAAESEKPHTKGELEVEYELARLVTGEDGQVTQPLHDKLEGVGRRESQDLTGDPAVDSTRDPSKKNGAPEAKAKAESQGSGAGGGVIDSQGGDGSIKAVHAVGPASEAAPGGGGGAAAGQGNARLTHRDSKGGWFARGRGLLRRALQRCELAAIGLVTQIVESSPSKSPLLRLFAALMAGPLRQPVLRFYAQASCHSRRLISIQANGKFDHIDSGPNSPLQSQASRFGEVVRELKQRQGVDYVYCWQAMAGYWSGIMPGAPGTAKYGSTVQYPCPSEGVLEVDPSFLWVQPVIAGVALPEDPRLFHQDLHTYLKESGVDGVKVDVQATICMFGHSGRGGYAAMGARWHGSLEDSVGRHLGGHCINSMCCSTEDLYNMSVSNIARVSEDFYPLIKASHWAHVANSAFVTLMVGVISTPDWDMFHSAHDAAHLHATARAVSGGMVYVSDKAGDNDFALLRRMVVPGGTTLRCALPGRPTADCLMCDVSRDGRTVLKVWNVNPCGGVVGLFNVQGATWAVGLRNYHQHDPSPPPLTAHVGPADVPRLPPAERYVAYSDGLQEVRVLGPNERWAVEVAGGGGHDLITLAPISRCGVVEAAAVGLVNMMNGGGAVRGFELREAGRNGDGPQGSCLAIVRLHGCGTLLLYASHPPMEATVDGEQTAVEYDEAKCTARVAVPQGSSGMDKVVVVRL